MDTTDLSLIDWSRAQFALTALYHWIFVPLTLGLTWIIAIMETKYYRTGSEKWLRITKFWAKLFGINFAVGVATGLILEFEFGTNWSNYSWFVGDIFGAPLAIEGIMAFFMETTFIAVMFFGWNRVGKGFHLTSTYLVALGANLSALWILVANAWMQDPVGMQFNPESARNEMTDFWAVLLSPTAINKFLHTVTSGYVTAGVFVVGVSSWFLLHRREKEFAQKSIKVASIFGLCAVLVNLATGDGAGKRIFQIQPMKLAAAEALVSGERNAPLTIIGYVSEDKKVGYDSIKTTGIAVPSMISFLADGKTDTFVPGIKDLIEGNEQEGILPVYEKMKRGR
ncbi:MAG: cytochrome ubiquinol oxidase subunit I, partial [Flavobacteriales bacterium]|nr:cytochrome ubiquinol oxidase subunit I [Flavobacteriales bacterium]